MLGDRKSMGGRRGACAHDFAPASAKDRSRAARGVGMSMRSGSWAVEHG